MIFARSKTGLIYRSLPWPLPVAAFTCNTIEQTCLPQFRMVLAFILTPTEGELSSPLRVPPQLVIAFLLLSKNSSNKMKSTFFYADEVGIFSSEKWELFICFPKDLTDNGLYLKLLSYLIISDWRSAPHIRMFSTGFEIFFLHLHRNNSFKCNSLFCFIYVQNRNSYFDIFDILTAFSYERKSTTITVRILSINNSFSMHVSVSCLTSRWLYW